jgi:peptidoglycan/LPS O-acetylase OafA/YrhL
MVLGDFSLIKRLADQTIASILLLGNYGAYKFSGDYFNPGIPNPFIHTWSLSVEEQFYILFPLLVLLASLISFTKSTNGIRIKILLSVVGIISLLLFIDSNILIPLYSKFFAVPKSFVFYSPITRLWQFSLGGLLSVFTSYKPNKYIAFIGIKAVVAPGLITLLFSNYSINQAAAAILCSFLGVIAISFHALDRGPQRIQSVLIWIGDRSYSIYLIHLPLIYLFLESPYTAKLSGLLRAFLCVALIISIVLLGDFMFRRVEERYRISYSAHPKVGNDQSVRKVFIAYQFTPLMLAIAVLFTIAQGFFGLVAQSTIPQEGDTFQKYCVRESFVRQFPCRFKGPSTGKKLLLLGDSHAAQYSIDIWKLGVADGYEVYFGGDFGGEIDSSGSIQDVQQLKPELTIVSKYWKVMDGKLVSGIEDYIRRFQSNSKRLVIIGQNPIFNASNTTTPRNTLLTIVHGARVNLGKRIEDRKNLDSQALIAGEAIKALARTLNSGYVDPSSILCNEKFCARWIQGGWLYIDNNHLSSLGAFQMVREIKKVLSAPSL